MPESGIYLIENTVDGKRYVGSSVNVNRRRSDHFRLLQRGTHQNRHLQAAFNKFGAAAFTFQILEYCPVAELVDREQTWIDAFNTVNRGYNIRPTAESNRGWHPTAEQRLNMAQAARRLMADPQYRERWAARLHETRSNPEIEARRVAALRQKMSNSAFIAQRTANTRRIVAALNADPVYAARQTAINREINTRPEVIAKLAARMRHLYEDPTERALQAERTRVTWDDPAIRERRIAGARAAMTPERRAQITATMQALTNTPEVKAARRVSTTSSWARLTPEERAARARNISEGKIRRNAERRAKRGG